MKKGEISGVDPELDLRDPSVRGDINKLTAAIKKTMAEVSRARAAIKQAVPSVRFDVGEAGEAGEAGGEKEEVRIFDFDGTLFETSKILGVPDTEFFIGYMRPSAAKKIRDNMLKDPKPVDNMINLLKSGDLTNTFILSMISSSGMDKPLAQFLSYLKTEDQLFKSILIKGLDMSEQEYADLVSSIPNNFEEVIAQFGHTGKVRRGTGAQDFGSSDSDQRNDSDETPDDDQDLEAPLGDEEGDDYEDRDRETDDFHYESKQLNKKVLKEGLSSFRLVMVKRK
jgi:hypothetical protein